MLSVIAASGSLSTQAIKEQSVEEAILVRREVLDALET